jgi:hypothetical protein
LACFFVSAAGARDLLLACFFVSAAGARDLLLSNSRSLAARAFRALRSG